jgi:pimeloyl-ACP methyl ester carboxylesterase
MRRLRGPSPTRGLSAGSLESQQAANQQAREASVTNSYVTVGSGDHHVLALHGWFGSARGWGSMPGFLDGSAYTYVFMNLRGYGDRQEVPGEFTIEEVAADALAVADDLGWDRFSVVGHSMGGKFAYRVQLEAPDRVRRLVALNPVPAGAVPFDDEGWALFSGAPKDPANRAAIIDFTTGNKLTKVFINQVVQHSLDNSTVEAFAGYLQAWAKSDFTAQTKVDTGTPVKVIVGVNDPALTADVMEQTWLVTFPNAEMTILPDAGHYPMFEAPVSLATSIEGFLGRD